MTDGKIENGLERGFVKHRLNYLLITDPKSSTTKQFFLFKTKTALVVDTKRDSSVMENSLSTVSE